MKITVLVDNVPDCGCEGEWGLSALIESSGKRILLDTGSTALFRKNAEKLGVDLSAVDYAVLSHAHYDHSGGWDAFFDVNQKAKLFLAAGTEENCFFKVIVRHSYIGIPRGVLAKYADRIVYAEGLTKLCEGAWLLSHSTPDLGKKGEHSRMYLREGRKYRPDDFYHEQTLVMEAEDGLIILNSCSHAGPDVILREVQEAFPGRHVRAYVGGLHLFRSPEAEVAAVAETFRASGIDTVYTGHCTGMRAFDQLSEALGTKVVLFRTGLVIEL